MIYREILTALWDRGKVKPVGYDFSDYVLKEDHFYSLYGFDRKVDDIDNYKPRVIDHLVLDIDKKQILPDLSNVYEMLELLDKHGVEFIPYFSGTGFNIVIPNCWNFHWKDIYNGTIKNTLLKIWDFLDPKVLHHRAIFRMPGTINSKSGLVKYPVDFSKNPGYMEIQGMASPDLAPVKQLPLPTKTGNLADKFPVVLSLHKAVVQVKFDATAIPSPKCIHGLLRSKPEKGQRHATALRMLSHLIHYSHLHPFYARQVVQSWWELGDGDVDEKWLVRAAKDVANKYRFGCNDNMLKAHCSPNCLYYKEKDYMSEPLKLRKVYESYRNMMQNGKWIDLQEVYPQIGHSFKLFFNYMFGIIGLPGSGKSAMATDIAMKLIEKYPDIHIVWANLDNSDELTARRIIQWKTGLSKEALEYPNDEQLAQINNTIDLLEKHVTFTHAASLLSMQEQLENFEKFGCRKKPDVWIVDHVGLMEHPVDGYQRMREISAGLKTFAKRNHILVIPIGHVTRKSEQSKVLNKHSCRDANLGEDCDVMAGIILQDQQIRSGRVLRSASRAQILSLKVRDDPPFDFTMDYNTDCFRFEEVDHAKGQKKVA